MQPSATVSGFRATRSPRTLEPENSIRAALYQTRRVMELHKYKGDSLGAHR